MPTPEDANTAGGLVSFVLPVYDEAGNLRELHQRIAEALSIRGIDYELVFVDDGSRDGSFAVLLELQREDPRHVRLIQLRRNFGKAAAYSAGFANARGSIIVTMDTDLQDDPAEIPLFLDKLAEGYDVVTGWKFEGKGNLEKSLPSRFFNRVVRKITGIPLHDFNCPFKAYRAEVLREIHIYGELHRYIPVLAAARGFTIAEIKIKNLPRKYGQSKYGLKRYVRGMLDLLTVVFITRFAKRPMHFMGLSGLLASGFGGGVIGFFIVAHFLYTSGLVADKSWVMHDRPALSLGILMLVVGAQFFTIGLLGELLVTQYNAAAADRGYSIKRIVAE